MKLRDLCFLVGVTINLHCKMRYFTGGQSEVLYQFYWSRQLTRKRTSKFLQKYWTVSSNWAREPRQKLFNYSNTMTRVELNVPLWNINCQTHTLWIAQFYSLCMHISSRFFISGIINSPIPCCSTGHLEGRESSIEKLKGPLRLQHTNSLCLTSPLFSPGSP